LLYGSAEVRLQEGRIKKACFSFHIYWFLNYFFGVVVCNDNKKYPTTKKKLIIRFTLFNLDIFIFLKRIPNSNLQTRILYIWWNIRNAYSELISG
jgi:hypothetical protein